MSDPSGSVVFAMSPDVAIRSVGDSSVLLNTKTGQIHTCNTTAQDFLQRVDGKQSLVQISDAMAQEYEVTPSELSEDLDELVSFLVDEGVVAAAKA